MKRKDTKYINFSEFDGYIAPQDVELEKVVLGTLMLEAGTMIKAEQFLDADVFYYPAHVEIYKAILSLYQSQEPYDIVTVTNKLRAEKQLDFVGGVYYIATLTNRVGGTGNIQSHCAILKQKSLQRKLIATGYDMVKVGYDDTKDCFDAIDEAEASVKSINVSLISSKTNLKTFRDLIAEEANAFDAIASGKNIGVKVNIDNLDKHTNGWQNGNLIIIAARPSMGKSVLALNNAKEAAKNNVPTAMFSLEMSSVELMQRLASDEADIDFSLVQKAKTTDEQRGRVNTALGRIENLPLYIDDTAQTTVLAIWNKAARIKSEYGLGLIVIDYIQLISAPEVGNYADANARVSHITRNLKLMAKELNVPVIALSQLSRDVEKRGGLKKPMLSDLRDSGCLVGETKIQIPSLKETIRIQDLVYRKEFSIFATDFKTTKQMKAKKAFSTGTKEVFEVTLLNGQKIQATSNHKFISSDGWAELGDLKEGDKMAIPINYGDIDDNTNSAEVSLVGHFLSNGSALKGQPIRYCQNIEDTDLTERVISDAIIATNNLVAPYYTDTVLDKSKFRTVFFKPTFGLARGKTSPIADIMRKYGLWDIRTKQKHIPDRLFYLNHDNTATLLRALFSGDGSVYYAENNGRKTLKISYSSASTELILGIQQLLAKIGIVSFISDNENTKKQKWQILYIAGKANIEVFVQKIGFYNKRKQDNLLLGWEKSKNNVAGWNKYDYNENRTLCLMPIKSIVSVGVKEVYDIEVPVLHNFIANNIIVHNSIEQDADVVVFPWRPSYYNITHDGNGFDYREDYAELIFAKHRNGVLGSVRVSFDGSKQRFTSYSEYTLPNIPPRDFTEQIKPNTNFDAPF